MKKNTSLPTIKPKTITAKKVRINFGEIMNRAHYGHEPYIITKQNKPMVILLGIEDYEDMVDLLDTMAEQLDPQFQKSLEQSVVEYRQEEVFTLADIKKELKQKTKNRC